MEHEHEHSETCNLKPYEAHLSSLCIAIVFGTIGGCLGLLFNEIFNITSVAGATCSIVGFIVAWVVCRYFFATAHEWYGHNSIAHRIYDIIGTISGLLVWYHATF